MIRGFRPALRRPLIAAGIAATLGGCVDTSASREVASVSLLSLPAPSVVLGDVLRDSAGIPAPLTVRVFDGRGIELPDQPVTFIALDQTVGIDPDGTVHGLAIDSVGARIIASVGPLQTPHARLFVTVLPEVITGGGTSAVLPFPPTTPQSSPADSMAHSAPLPVTVTNAAGQAAQGIVVYFEIVSAPPSVDPALPIAFVSDDSRRMSDRDTTDRSGGASRRITLLHRRATGGLAAGTDTDTVTVRVVARYSGTDIAGSPLTFKIPVRMQQ